MTVSLETVVGRIRTRMLARGIAAKNFAGAIEFAAERVRFYSKVRQALLDLPLDHVAVIDPDDVETARRLARDAMRALMALPSSRRRPKRFADPGSDEALISLGADDELIEARES